MSLNAIVDQTCSYLDHDEDRIVCYLSKRYFEPHPAMPKRGCIPMYEEDRDNPQIGESGLYLLPNWIQKAYAAQQNNPTPKG